MKNIVLVPARPWKFMGIAENDQALGGNGQCERFECQDWDGDVQLRPDLERDERTGFWLCPMCGVSYGKEAIPPQPWPIMARSAP